MAVLVNVVGKYSDRDIEKARKALDDLGKQAKGPTASGFTKLGSAAAGAIAGIGITVFAKQSIDAFAEVQDAQSALQATYGDTGDAIIDYAKRSGDALNLSQREALNAATTFANFGRAAGKTGQDLVGFTTPLIERAADAASYFGGTTSDAVEAFGAALRGEMEPIRRYGVLLDDATLRSKALELGLVASTKNALTPQVKTLAAQALILEKTSQAQGDVARTSDSMANQIKDAQQQMDDFKTSTGETLSVAVGPLLKGLNSAVGVFNALPQPTKSAALAIGAVGAAALIAGPRVLALRRELAATSMLAGKSGTAIRGVGKAITALAITQAVAAMDNYNDSINSNTDDMERLLTGLGSTGQGFDKLGYTVDGWTQYTKDFNDVVARSQAPDWLDRIGQGLGSLTGMKDDLTLAQESLSKVDDALASMVKGGHANDATFAVARLRSEFIASGRDVAIFDGALTGYQAAIKASVAPTVELGKAASTSANGVKALKGAFESLDGLLSKRAALRAWKGDLDGVSEAVKKAGGSFGTGSAKGREFNDFLDGMVGDLANASKAFEDPKKQADFFADGLKTIRTRFIKAGIKPEDVDKFLRPFKNAKKDVRQAGREIAVGLAEGLDEKANFALARARALGKATALEVKAGAEVSSPSRITIKVGEEIANGLPVGVKKKAGAAKKAIRNATKDILAGADDALQSFRDRGQEVLDFIAGVKGSITSFGSIAGFEASDRTAAAADFAKQLGLQGKTGLFAAPDQQGTTASVVLGQKSTKVAQAKTFGKDIAALRGLKLNNADLQDIIGLGPVAGHEVAQALIQGGKAAVAQANSLQRQLEGAAASIGDSAALSQYGINGAQAKALTQLSVKFEKGSVVVNADGASAGDLKKIEAAAQRGTDKAIRKAIREMRANR